jgi:hypothetical protein
VWVFVVEQPVSGSFRCGGPFRCGALDYESSAKQGHGYLISENEARQNASLLRTEDVQGQVLKPWPKALSAG